jgi:hypothetical protein
VRTGAEPPGDEAGAAACAQWDEAGAEWQEPADDRTGVMQEMRAPKWDAIPPTRQ